ncbi:hypothetical protein CB1_06 [Pectobacterium phage vB_PatP_CB1]|uniref:Uncharacterized protein n=1 Tax=Pectobacterium phage vB_PatP_CB1 TaxID=1958917 RepID=A0A2P0PAL9_9CAUD|nr:hypothetical protein HWB08_gp06 [Pectobacterium phage vB_PatP_CB1]ARB11733.1 hypothetical protein CB1_06 [Pectobacterium phage vB_PatP_CB1]
MMANMIHDIDALHQTIVEARKQGFEIRLEREHARALTYPRIARRLMQTHLGQQYYTNRIEITIYGVEYYLAYSAEYREGCKPELKAQVEHTLDKLVKHVAGGGYLNMHYWKEVTSE